MSVFSKKHNVDADQLARLGQRIEALTVELVTLRQTASDTQQTLAEQLRHRIAFEQLVHEISTKFTRYKLTRAIDHIPWALEQVGTMIGAQRGYVFSLQNRAIQLTHQWHHDQTPVVTPRQLFPRAASHWWESFFSSRQPVQLPNVTNIDDEGARAVLHASGIQSLLLVPLAHHGRFHGLLGFDTLDYIHSWPEADITLLQIIGELFVAALDKQAREDRLHLADYVGQNLTQILEPDQLLARMTTVLQEKLGYYYTQLFLIHDHFFLLEKLPEPEVLVLYKGSGDVSRHLVTSGYTIPLTTEKSLIATAGRTGKTAVANQARQNKHFLPNALLAETRAEIALPLQLDDTLLGVLDIQSRRANTFDTAEQRILQTITNHLAIALSNARLFTRNRRLLKEVQALHTVATTIAEDKDSLIRQTTAIVGDMLYPENFGVRLVLPDGSLEDHPSCRVKQVTIDNRLVTGPGEGVTGQVAATGKPIRLGNVHENPDYLPTNDDIQSELCVPITINDDVIGVINTESPQPNAFSEADERLLTTLARQVGVSLARLHLIQTLQERANQSESLTQAAGIIAAALDERQLWRELQQAAEKLLAAPYTAVYLHNPANQAINCPFAHGVSGKFIKNLHRHFDTMPDGKAIHANQPVIINNVATDPRVAKMHHMLEAEGIVAYGVFPLPSSPQAAFGAIVHYRLHAKPFTDTDIHIGSTLAHITAVTLQNVRLFSEMSQALSRERNLNHLTRTLSSTRDLPTILANIIQQAAELIEADTGLLGLVIDNQMMTFYPVNLPNNISLRPSPRNQSMAWHIVDSTETICLKQYGQHPHAQPQWLKADAQAYIGVPISVGRESLGTIELFQLGPEKQFSERDQRLLESVGRQAGITIQNARLFIEAEQRTSALASALARQEELDQLKNVFIQNVSHELRTPLGIIYGHAELLTSGNNTNLNDVQQQSLEIIVRRTRMLADLVEELSTLLAAETQEFRRELISPSQLLHSMTADYRMQAEALGIHLMAEITDDLPFVQGDPTHLRRVLDNLVSNAFKYTDTDGTVTLKAWREQSEVYITVSDTGTGISEENLPRIFERFFQITDGSTPRKKGTGLGLALVKEIVEAHRGYVSVRSELNVGTTFEVMLPVHEPGSTPNP